VAAFQPASRPTQSTSAPAVGPTTQAAAEAAQVVKEVIKGPNPELKQLEAQLREAEEALVSARTFGHMTDVHPKVQSMMARIAEIKNKIENTPKEAVLQTVYANPQPIAGPPSDRLGIFALTDAKGALDAAVLEAATIDSQLFPLQKTRDKAEALMANIAPIRQKYMELAKKIADTQAELAGWQKRLSEIEMSLAAEAAGKRTHLAAIQPAQEQFLPSSPALLMVLGFSIGGALAFGVGLVFLANMFDRTISTPDGVAEEFGLPVHGVIGEIVLAKERRKRRLLNWVAVPAVLAVVVVCVAGAGLSIVLWLKYPEQYTRLHAAPVAYLYQDVVQAIQWITGLFH
jgi:predicted  nucleic acid-binding Zn-ribbon protein